MTDDELDVLEAAFEKAFRTGGDGGLDVLGYGEITSVVAFTSGGERLAVKRLPAFESEARLDAYRLLFEEYLAELSATGVRLVPTRLECRASEDGSWRAYCVQPAVDAEALGPRLFARASSDEVAVHGERLFRHVRESIAPRRGFDGQLSNWVHVDGEWLYVDVTTPLLRDAGGRERLDADLFLAALPWPLRWPVRRFLLHAITSTYYDARQVTVDFLGNLLKERLGAHLPVLLEVANRHLPAIGEDEVRAYYRSDARLWAALLALRRLDRSWQLKVRRRPYPFLLPGRIER